MQDSDEIRERVLDRSTEHFFSRGFSRVTSDELAREAGISKKTLYQRFRSKEEILQMVIEREMGRISARLDEVFNDPRLPYTEKLKSVMQITASQLARLGPAVLEDIYRSTPRLWTQIDQSRQKMFFGRLEALIRQGTAEGMLRQDVDPRITLALLQTAMQHLMIPDQVIRLSLSPVQIFESLFRIILHGLLTDEVRPQLTGATAPEKRAAPPEGGSR